MPNEPEKQIKIRLPESLHADISALADRDLRSLQAEIVFLLRKAVATRKSTEGSSEDEIRAPESLAGAYTY